MQKCVKRFSILMLSLVLLLTMVTGCNKLDLSSGTSSNTTTASSSGTTAGTGSSAEEKTSIVDNSKLSEVTVFADMDPATKQTCKDLNDHEVFKELEKRTGVKVNWIHPTEVHQQFTLLVASGSYPDVIMYHWKDAPGGVAKYEQDGVILKLNDLIKDYAPDFARILDEYPAVKKDISDPEGNLYYLARLILTPESNIFKGPLIRRDWLEKLNLNVPTNVDELYDVLIAFRDGDPNGNNKKDEWGMSGGCYADGGGFMSSAAFSVGMITWAWGIDRAFYIDNGQIKFGPLQPEFKEVLMYMNKLKNEGLLDPDYLLNDRSKLDAKVMNEQVGFLFHYQPTNFLTKMADVNPEFDLVGIPYLSGPNGQKGNYDPSLIQKTSADGLIAITTSAKYPEEIMKWLNYGYTEEGNLLFNFGIEGESYNIVNGVPTYTDLIKNNPDGLALNVALGKWTMGISKWASVQDVEVFRQYTVTDYSRESIQAWASSIDFDPNERILPTLERSPEDAEKYSAIWIELKTYVEQMTDRFIFGKESFDNYDAFLDTIKSLKVEEALKLQQQAYDRFMAK